jgi:hypothetical protein
MSPPSSVFTQKMPLSKIWMLSSLSPSRIFPAWTALDLI